MRAAGGRVVLGDGRPEDPPLPAELQAALRQWAAFAVAVDRSGMDAERDFVRRRGRQLASRVAELRGRPVRFVDPMSGAVESVRATIPFPRESTPGRSAPGRSAPRRSAPVEPAPHRSPLAVEPAGHTPWSTGLPVALFFAVFVAIGDVVLSTAFAEAFGLLWVPANLLVGLGLAPSLYLLRAVRFWRWVALGATVGLGVAWLVLLLGLLG
ncbi:MAG: DUF2537 domain-containing protein [Pseudonocardia sp.]|nr:DUF2537 domain-containing protein [Pseudonocardia sp.]